MVLAGCVLPYVQDFARCALPPVCHVQPSSGTVGAAYFFGWNGSQWVQTQKVQASDGADGGFFGCAVALEGDTAVIGRFWDSAAGAQPAGSAYVFTRNAETWSETQKLVGNNPHVEDQFGYALALSGDRIVVGAPERFSDGPADLQLGQARTSRPVGRPGPVPQP
jgi:hypothetical protein